MFADAASTTNNELSAPTDYFHCYVVRVKFQGDVKLSSVNYQRSAYVKQKNCYKKWKLVGLDTHFPDIGIHLKNTIFRPMQFQVT